MSEMIPMIAGNWKMNKTAAEALDLVNGLKREELIAAGSVILHEIYFDSLVFTPEAIRHLVAQVGASQLVIGSDYPYPWQLQPVDHIFASTSLSDDEKADILGRTAAKLFNVQA